MSPAESKVWKKAYDEATEHGAHPGAAVRAAEAAVQSRRELAIRKDTQRAALQDREASEMITRAALYVASTSLKALADDLEALDTADTCRAAGEIRAILRTLRTANPGKPQA